MNNNNLSIKDIETTIWIKLVFTLEINQYVKNK